MVFLALPAVLATVTSILIHAAELNFPYMPLSNSWTRPAAASSILPSFGFENLIQYLSFVEADRPDAFRMLAAIQKRHVWQMSFNGVVTYGSDSLPDSMELKENHVDVTASRTC